MNVMRPRRATSTVVIALATTLFTAKVLALDPKLTIKQLHHTAWGPSQGAPLGGAIDLAQTTDGYLWMICPTGLFRFDGISFEKVELPRDPKLSSLRLFSVFAPRSGGLWIGFTFGGAAFLKDGSDAEQLLAAADRHMYQAKEASKMSRQLEGLRVHASKAQLALVS